MYTITSILDIISQYRNVSYNGYYVPITIPEEYDDTLPDFENHNNIIKLSLREIVGIFDMILNKIVIVKSVNKKYIKLNREKYICDYCKITSSHFVKYCNECKMNMCMLCYSERTEDDAKKNNAVNWNSRKDILNRCFKHESDGKFNEKHVKSDPVYCDMCGVSSNTKKGFWLCNRRKDIDFCISCSNNYSVTQLTQLVSSFKFTNMNDIQLDISIADWFPIYIDGNYIDIIAYNINKKSAMYKKIVIITEISDRKLDYTYTNMEFSEILPYLYNTNNKRPIRNINSFFS